MRKIWARFQKNPPVVQALYLLVLTLLTTFVSRLFVTNERDPQGLKRYLDKDFIEDRQFLQLFLLEPMKEELVYRGPIWLLMLISEFISRRFPGNRFSKYCSLPILLIALAISSVLWATPHVYPLTYFLYGCVLGYIILRSKSVFSLVYVMAFHLTLNAFALISIWLGFNIAL